MTHQLYWFCVLMYVSGMALTLFWLTVPSLKEKCRISNKKFTWGEWWECDWNLVIGNFIFGFILVLGLDELIKWKPGVLDYVKWLFAVAGSFLTTIAQEKWGQFKKQISKLIDIKTNIADVVTGGTTTIKETIEKGSQATGTDVTVKPDN